MSIPEEAWNEAVAAIRSADEVALTCHLGPDGDALGSLLALTRILRDMGKRTVASWGSDPFVTPKHYSFLPSLDLVSPPSEFPDAPALLVTFDTGSIERLGTLAPNAERAERVVVVDHHASGEPFGDIRLVDPAVAASAVLVYELAHRLGAEIDRDTAICLYTGLVTDTGAFKYRNTTPPILEIAADLLRRGIPHDDIVREVYDTHPFGYLKLAGQALERAELAPEALGGKGLIWTWITQKDLAAHEIDIEDTEALIDIVRTADVAEVACVLKEQADGRYKVSMRSKGGADVGAVAAHFGGGGHAFAAGFTTPDADVRAAVAGIVDRLALQA